MNSRFTSNLPELKFDIRRSSFLVKIPFDYCNYRLHFPGEAVGKLWDQFPQLIKIKAMDIGGVYKFLSCQTPFSNSNFIFISKRSSQNP